MAGPALARDPAVPAREEPRLIVSLALLHAPDGPPMHGGATPLRRSAPVAVEAMTAGLVAVRPVAHRLLRAEESVPNTSDNAEFLLVVGSPLPAWRLSSRLPPVTAHASGYYAVRDTLAQYHRPRALRPSALATTLTLRLDGEEESPPLSIEGGGVPAALWAMMPKR